MYECLEAVYCGEIWTATQLKNRDGDYDQNLRLSMKKESQGHAFFCPECGENLILCAGNIREPYFRHYDGSECVIAREDKAKRYYAMLACMEELAKRSYPNSKITRYGAISDSMRSQLIVETDDAVYAFNYASDSINLKHLQEKMECLNECGIIPVWFTIQKENLRQSPTTVEYAVSRFQPLLKTIIPEKRMVTLKEYNHLGNRLLLKETYYFDEMILDASGEFVCDFNKRLNRIQTKEKEKELLGERLAKYFSSKISSDNMENYESAVMRLPESSDHIPETAVYMSSLEEFWVPKKLIGEPEKRKIAQSMREAFLYYVDLLLEKQEKTEYEQIIKNSLTIIEKNRKSEDWIVNNY